MAGKQGRAGHSMRILSMLVLLIVLVVGGAWLGGESWLAGRVATEADTRPGLDVHAVAPLRQPDRIGVRLTAPSLQGRDMALDLPWFEAWVSPLRPTEARFALPGAAVLRVAGRDLPVTIQDGAAALRVAPLYGGSVRRAAVSAKAMTLDGKALFDGVELTARMAGLGATAPQQARSAYDLDLMLSGLDTQALSVLGVPPLVLPGQLTLSGPATLWLDGIAGPAMLGGAVPPPQPVGLRSTGLNLRIGKARARLAGVLQRSEDGNVEGRLAIYTGDGTELLRQASSVGLIPADAAMLASALLKGLGRMPFPEGSDVDGLALPDPAEGELRLPVVMKDGRLYLGGVEIGPAPRFPQLM